MGADSKKIIAEVQAKKQKAINLDECGLSAIPNTLYDLQGLQKICLSNNKIREIPPGVTHFSNLETLSLYNNKIDKICQEVNSLPRLVRLILSNNNIAELPTGL